MSAPALEELLAAHEAAPPAACLKRGERGPVTRLPYDARGDAVCKEDLPPRLRSRLASSLRGSRARRAQRAAGWLAAAGLPAAEVLGALERGPRSFLFTRHVPGPTLQAALEEAGPREREALVRAALDLAAALFAAGLCVRDLKPDNLIVSAASPPRLVLIDFDGVRRVRRPSRRLTLRPLAALDAYAQLLHRPLGARARVAGLRHFADLRGLEPGPLLLDALRASREKRARLEARRRG